MPRRLLAPPTLLRRLSVLLAVWLLSGGWFWQDPIHSKTQKGNELLASEQFGEALNSYRDAQLDDPANPVLSYNAGRALLGQNKAEEAIEEFTTAINGADDVSLQTDAYYNRSVARFQAEKYEEAVDDLIKVLELRPDDQDAKHNLEFIRRKIAEQAQKQQEENKDQQQKQQQDPNQQQDQNDQSSSEQQDGEKQQQQEEGSEQQQQQQQEQGEQGSPTPQAGQQQTPGDEQGTPTPQARPTDGEQGQEQDQNAPQPEGTPTEIELSKEEAEQLLRNLEEKTDLQKRMQRLRQRKDRKEKYW